jgi:hypothetical protein
MAEETNPFVEEAHEGALNLQRLRQEVELRLHLAGMDARDAWGEVRGRLQNMERAFRRLGERVGTAGNEAEMQLHLGILELQDRWNEVELHLGRIVDEIERGTEKARRAAEQGRVQAHLARLDVEEDLQVRLDRVRGRLKSLGSGATAEAGRILGRVVDALNGLAERARAAGPQRD